MYTLSTYVPSTARKSAANEFKAFEIYEKKIIEYYLNVFFLCVVFALLFGAHSARSNNIRFFSPIPKPSDGRMMIVVVVSRQEEKISSSFSFLTRRSCWWLVGLLRHPVHVLFCILILQVASLLLSKRDFISSSDSNVHTKYFSSVSHLCADFSAYSSRLQEKFNREIFFFLVLTLTCFTSRSGPDQSQVKENIL